MKLDCCFIAVSFVFLIIGIPCTLYGCDKNIQSTCLMYNIVDSKVIDNSVKQTVCGSHENVYVCYSEHITVSYWHNDTCNIYLGSSSDEDTANKDVDEYPIDSSLEIYISVSDGSCKIDEDTQGLLY